jgi:hypothetical protein
MINDSIDQTLRMIQIISEEKNNGLSVIFRDWYNEVSDMSKNVLDDNDNFNTEYINGLDEHFEHLTIYDLDGNVLNSNISNPVIIKDYIYHMKLKQYYRRNCPFLQSS